MAEPGEKFTEVVPEFDPAEHRPHGQRKRGVSKYSHLLEENSAFRAWYRNVLRGSLNTPLGTSSTWGGSATRSPASPRRRLLR